MVTERSDMPIRRVSLRDEGGPDPAILAMTIEERIALLERLREQAWAYFGSTDDERRLRRDVGRVVRSGG